jgi:hypothetical protein
VRSLIRPAFISATDQLVSAGFQSPILICAFGLEGATASRAGVAFQSPRLFATVVIKGSLGSFPAVPAGQRRGRSTSISGPPPRVTRRPDDNALDLLS